MSFIHIISKIHHTIFCFLTLAIKHKKLENEKYEYFLKIGVNVVHFDIKMKVFEGAESNKK